MMSASVRCAALLVLALIAGACSDSSRDRPRTPTQPDNPTPAPSPTPAPPDGASRVFVFASALEAPLSVYTRTSEYRLSEDGTFMVWYASYSHGYRGTYTQAEGVIAFKLSGEWAAAGVLNDKTLTVRYNFDAQLSGFENAVYTLKD